NSICSRIGFSASAANSLARFCNSATLSGYSAARLVLSDGSFAILKSSTDWGSRVCQTSFQSPSRTAPRKGSMLLTISVRGGLAFADSTPDAHTIERLALVEISTRKLDQSGIEVDGVDHLVHGAAFPDMSGPIVFITALFVITSPHPDRPAKHF